MLDDIRPQIVSDGLRIPARGPQQALHPIRTALPQRFRHLPAVPPLQRVQQASEELPGAVADFWAGKAGSNARVQGMQCLLPPRDLGDLLLFVLGDRHGGTPPALQAEVYPVDVPL